MGAYVVLKLFERLGDVELLRYAYPYLQRWHDYWSSPRQGGSARRDGNGDGLLEWGSDGEQIGKNVPSWERTASGRMRAGWESGQDDLPNWDDARYSDETGTLTMNCIDLNSLYALDAWCLAEMASVLGRPGDVERYRGEYDKVKALVNAGLWNEKEGFYFDRHWDGRFSWLAGGAVKVNKKTWYAHLHKGKRYGRMYSINQAEIIQAHNWAADYWMGNKWEGRIHDIDWLVDKFWPVPTWPDDWREAYAYQPLHTRA